MHQQTLSLTCDILAKLLATHFVSWFEGWLFYFVLFILAWYVPSLHQHGIRWLILFFLGWTCFFLPIAADCSIFQPLTSIINHSFHVLPYASLIMCGDYLWFYDVNGLIFGDVATLTSWWSITIYSWYDGGRCVPHGSFNHASPSIGEIWSKGQRRSSGLLVEAWKRAGVIMNLQAASMVIFIFLSDFYEQWTRCCWFLGLGLWSF